MTSFELPHLRLAPSDVSPCSSGQEQARRNPEDASMLQLTAEILQNIPSPVLKNLSLQKVVTRDKSGA